MEPQRQVNCESLYRMEYLVSFSFLCGFFTQYKVEKNL